MCLFSEKQKETSVASGMLGTQASMAGMSAANDPMSALQGMARPNAPNMGPQPGQMPGLYMCLNETLSCMFVCALLAELFDL